MAEDTEEVVTWEAATEWEEVATEDTVEMVDMEAVDTVETWEATWEEVVDTEPIKEDHNSQWEDKEVTEDNRTEEDPREDGHQCQTKKFLQLDLIYLNYVNYTRSNCISFFVFCFFFFVFEFFRYCLYLSNSLLSQCNEPYIYPNSSFRNDWSDIPITPETGNLFHIPRVVFQWRTDRMSIEDCYFLPTRLSWQMCGSQGYQGGSGRRQCRGKWSVCQTWPEWEQVAQEKLNSRELVTSKKSSPHSTDGSPTIALSSSPYAVCWN